MNKLFSLKYIDIVVLLLITGTANCTVRQDLIADFSAEPTTGYAPLEIAFTDTSTGMPTSWSWDFGDGATSVERNPIHTYAGGTYDVTLVVSNANGVDTARKSSFITVTDTTTLLSVEFSASPLSGTAPLEVSFSDQSQGNPDAWDWDFGDGEVSTDRNPSHAYGSAGSYDVTLTVSNALGADTMTKASYITVSENIAYKDTTVNGITIRWRVMGTDLEVVLSAPTTGWISAGFNPSMPNHKDANIIIGYVKNGTAYIQDNFGTGAYVHSSDVSLGGEDNVSAVSGSEASGTTEIHFVIPLDSGDAYDRVLLVGEKYLVILACGPNGADDYTSQHVRAGFAEIVP